MTLATCDVARRWFLNKALPIWLDRGVDRSRGGFFEALDQSKAENTSDFRRLRVATRQIYVCAAGLRLGAYAAREGLENGLAFLLESARHSGGGFATKFDLNNAILDVTRDLYDQAFAAFALAHAYDATGITVLAVEADRLAAFITQSMRHPAGGFVEALPPSLPRRQNPHMHLLEASLAWAGLRSDGPYRDLAAELAALFQNRFFQAAQGCLPEYFDDALIPLTAAQDQVVEPGHHFEWIWLLHHAARLGVLDPQGEADALHKFAITHGIDPCTSMPYGELSTDGALRSRTCRLWSVSEWLKAECVYKGQDRDGRVAKAWAALARFLDVPIPGLWHERWDGTRFVPGAAPASTFYHIVLAIESMLETYGQHPRPFAQNRRG